MKKILTFALAALMILSLISCAAKNSGAAVSYKAGTYSGVGKGRNGDINVKVVLKKTKIAKITVGAHSETPGISDAPLKNIPEAIIAGQTLAVDTVSGATLSSEGIIAAVADALESAGVDTSKLQTKNDSAVVEIELKDATYDVVIIGAGGAGLTAAVQAKVSGAEKVALIEKTPIAGGNTIRSGAAMAVPGHPNQVKAGIEDNAEMLVKDMNAGGGNIGNQDLISTLAHNATKGALWLGEYVEVDWRDAIAQESGHVVPRFIEPKTYGPGLITPLVKKAEELGVEIMYSTKAEKLVQDKSGRVTGVVVSRNGKEATISGTNGVVIASGGFGANVEMREKYNTKWATLDENIPTSNSPAIQGEGIEMAQAIGANLVGMEYIQLYPFNNPATGVYYNIEGPRWNHGGGIYVNLDGERFVNEMATRDLVSEAIFAQEESIAFFLYNQAAADEKNMEVNLAHEYASATEQGVFIKADTLKECADFFGVNAENLKATVSRWNKMVADGEDTEFNRVDNLKQNVDGPWFMMKGLPSVHHTMGGIEIDSEAHVIDTDGNIIPGLYAAGETTGGIHGTNRLGTCAIADIIVFGRIAGASAAERK